MVSITSAEVVLDDVESSDGAAVVASVVVVVDTLLRPGRRRALELDSTVYMTITNNDSNLEP